MAVNIRTNRDIRLFTATDLKDLYDKEEIKVITNLLLKKYSGLTRLSEIYDDNLPVPETAYELILKAVEELKNGKPIQYIICDTEFYGCIIRLNSDTLIPRPETEELTEIVIKENTDFRGTIIDFCSGSGCIAVALSKNIKGADITGVEISPEAVTVAKENAELNNVSARFITADIFSIEDSGLPEAGIIVSNPPYVRHSEKALMKKNVLDFEPHRALFVDDTNPLVFYIEIIKIAETKLIKNGKIYFEINEAMGTVIADLLKTAGYNDIRIINDINQKNRFAYGRKR